MGINWKVRLKNKMFWLGIIPAVLLLIVQVAAVFGYNIDFTVLQPQLIAIVETVFLILAILGIVVDPTTEGIDDSKQAMGYTAPKRD